MRPRTEKDRETVRRGHTCLPRVELWKPSGKVADLPIEEGSVSWTLSAEKGTRSGSLSIPGYEWHKITEPGQGTWVNITATIENSTWNLGQWPVTRSQVARPGGRVELTLGDWSFRRSIPMGETAATIGDVNTPVAQTVAEYLSHVLPPVTCTRDDSNGALPYAAETIQLGASVWGALTNLCKQRYMIPVVTSRQTVEIRDYRGPHTGTPNDDVTGTIIREQLEVHADASRNRVMTVIDVQSDAGPIAPGRGDRILDTGPYKYDQYGFGENTMVIHETRYNVTPAFANYVAQDLANYYYGRGLGLVRTHDLDVIPMPWLEVGDWISYTSSVDTTASSTPAYEVGRIESLTFPLTADGVQRIALRDQVVK